MSDDTTLVAENVHKVEAAAPPALAAALIVATFVALAILPKLAAFVVALLRSLRWTLAL